MYLGIARAVGNGKVFIVAEYYPPGNVNAKLKHKRPLLEMFTNMVTLKSGKNAEFFFSNRKFFN